MRATRESEEGSEDGSLWKDYVHERSAWGWQGAFHPLLMIGTLHRCELGAVRSLFKLYFSLLSWHALKP